jgi:hypothetical protein
MQKISRSIVKKVFETVMRKVRKPIKAISMPNRRSVSAGLDRVSGIERKAIAAKSQRQVTIDYGNLDQRQG